MKIVVGTAILFVLALSAATGIYAFPFGKYERIEATADVVSLPVTRLADGKAHFYRFSARGKEISFFAVKAQDGSYRTAFDACEVCYKEKKGFKQVESSMVCKNCNKSFDIPRISQHETGGCSPCYLAHRQNGAFLIIRVSDLAAGARFF
jgi:uncharacterized membrane protein